MTPIGVKIAMKGLIMYTAYPFTKRQPSSLRLSWTHKPAVNDASQTHAQYAPYLQLLYFVKFIS